MFYTTPYRTAPGGCCAPFVPLAGKTNNQERNKNMKPNRKAAVLALGLALLAPLAGAQEVVDSEWWNVNFDGSFQEGFEGLTIGELGALTNNESKGNVVQPYASGVWEALDGDESYVTNECYPSASGGTNWCIKLDTQGNDLTWTPTNEVNGVTNIYQKIALVDADLYLVGSDSAPDPADFDANADVQSAIFLKNETDEDSGETTNSVLCVYVTVGKNTVWQELEGRAKTPTNDIPDNAWYRVTVLIDHETNPGTPMVEVYVDGIPLHARGNPAMTSFMAANTRNASTVGRIQSVSFRGTGAIDNFVGKTRKETYPKAYFKAVAFLDDGEQPFMERTTKGDPLEIGKDPATFTDPFYFDSIELTGDLTYALDRIEVDDMSTDPSTTRTYRFEYNDTEDELFPLVELDPDPTHIFVETETEDGESWQTGNVFIRNLSTAGATQPENYEDPATAITIARLYFKTLGAFYANAVTEIGDNVVTNGTLLKPVAAGGTYPTNLVWTFPATDGANVLTGVKVENGATATYDSATRVATATVTLATALETNKTFVTATYAEGSYEGKTPSWIDNGNGSYVLGNYVAKIDGDPKPVYYTTLQAAIAAVQEDAATTSTVTLLASVDEDVTIPLGKNIELDLNGCAITNVDSDTISVYGTLVLTDSSENTNGIVASAIANKAAIVNYPGGNVVIEAGTIAVPDDATYYNIKNMGAMTIEEGAVIVSRVSTASTLIANGWYGNAATDRGTTGQADTAILTINGGMFDGGKNVVKNDDYGILVIEGGSFSNLSDVDAVILNWNDTTINGGEFTGVTKILCNGSYGANSADKGVMTINGGTFRANGEQGNLFGYGTQGGKMSDALLEITGGTFYGHVAGLGDNDGTFGVAAISGGSFSEVVPQIYCAQDFVPVTTADPVTGLYTVKPGSIQVTDGTDVFTYGAFADAIPVHGWGATYTLLTNVEETVTITNADDTFTVLFADADFTNDLAVVSGVAATPSTEYAVVCTNIAGGAVWLLEPTVRTYDVMFMNGGAQFATTNVAYGTTEYAPTGTPTKAATAQFSYAFAGWSDTADGEALASLPAITNDATFYAAFAATTNEYTITWTMDDDSVIDTTTVAYGATPTHADPTKDPTAEFSYEFAGWSPEVVEVTGEATYKATFTATTRSYAVTFWTNEVDVGEAWFSTNAPYGTLAAAYAPTNDPTKAATTTTNFTFAGWTNAVAGGETVATADLPAVTGAASWLAVWTETPIWKVTFKNGDDTIYETNYLDGATAEYVGATPTKAATAQYAYTFAGWDPALGAVTADTVYAATFSSNAVEYAIAYDLDGGQWPAGYTPTNSYTVESAEIVLPTPVKDGYAFNGWTNALGAAATGVAAGSTGDQSFGATWVAAALDPVDPGQDMTDQEKIDNPPVAVVTDPVTGDVAFTVHFRGEEGVTYQLVASESCAITEEQWKGEAASGNAVPVGQAKTTDDADQNGIIELVVPMSGDNVPDVRFFKIKATR